MKEIKFRAWVEVDLIGLGLTYVMDYFTLRNITLDGEFVNGENYFFVLPEDKFIMQYTGLKDKNGVEIYENMVIDNIYKVGFDNATYILTNISNGDIVLLSKYFGDKNGQIEITKEYTQV